METKGLLQMLASASALPSLSGSPALCPPGTSTHRGSGKSAGGTIFLGRNSEVIPERVLPSLALFGQVADARPNVSMETDGKPLPFR